MAEYGALEKPQRLARHRASLVEDWLNDATNGGNVVVTFPTPSSPDALVCVYMTVREAQNMLNIDSWPTEAP